MLAATQIVVLIGQALFLAQVSASADPTAPAPATVTPLPHVRLELQSSPRGLLYLWKAAPDQVRGAGVVRYQTGRFSIIRPDPERFVDLCEAPCEARLPLGRIELGLSTDFGKSMTTRIFDATEPSLVQGEFVSRRYVRLAGLLVMLAGVSAGLVLGGSSEAMCDPILKPGEDVRCHSVHPHLTKGLITAGVSVLLGTPLLFVPDRIGLEARPAPPRL